MKYLYREIKNSKGFEDDVLRYFNFVPFNIIICTFEKSGLMITIDYNCPEI